MGVSRKDFECIAQVLWNNGNDCWLHWSRVDAGLFGISLVSARGSSVQEDARLLSDIAGTRATMSRLSDLDREAA